MSQESTNHTRTLLIFACLFFIIGCVKISSSFLVPIIISVFLSSVCLSIAFWLYDRGVNYLISVFLSFIALTLLVALLFVILSAGISDLAASLPLYRDMMEQRLADLQGVVDTMGKYGISSSAFEINKYLSLIIEWLTGLGTAFTGTGIVLIITFFAVFGGLNLSKNFTRAFPDYSFSQMKEMIKMVNDYLVIKTIINIISGVLIAIALLVMDVRHAMLFGFLVFLLNFIPAIGIVLAGILPCILVWIEFGFGFQFAMVLSLFVALNLVLSVVEPKVTGDKFGLSGLFVILSLIFWSWLFGSAGMFLAVPLTMIIKIISHSSQSTRWLSVLMS